MNYCIGIELEVVNQQVLIIIEISGCYEDFR